MGARSMQECKRPRIGGNETKTRRLRVKPNFLPCVLGEEQSTTESEPDGSKESDAEESEMRSGEENGLEDQTASMANPNSLSHAHTHGATNALGESREDSLSLEAE